MYRQNFIMLLFCIVLLALSVSAQIDDICAEFGHRPTLAAPRLQAPYIYGKVEVLGRDLNAKFPKVTVTYTTGKQLPSRLTVSEKGNYCFPLTDRGMLIAEIDGAEVLRKDVQNFGPAQVREDLRLWMPGVDPKTASPGVVSSKFNYPQNEKTAEFYRKALEAEKAKDFKSAIKAMKQVVEIDEKDFIGWGHLGTLYFEKGDLDEAFNAYRKSITLREDYTPAWINVGRLRVAQKQFEAAVEVFKHAAALEPENARIFRLLGEAYLQNKQGALGAQALNHAIRLDPVGQAECHLHLAHLYQLAGAKHLASEEYSKFLEKVPEHPDKKKFRKFIKENPPEKN